MFEVFVAGQAVSVTYLFPEGTKLNTFYVSSLTTDNSTPHWHEFIYDLFANTGAKYNGNSVTVHYVDGQRGDSDLSADGIAVDPAAPAFKQPTVSNVQVTLKHGRLLLHGDDLANTVQIRHVNRHSFQIKGLADTTIKQNIQIPSDSPRFIASHRSFRK